MVLQGTRQACSQTYLEMSGIMSLNDNHGGVRSGKRGENSLRGCRVMILGKDHVRAPVSTGAIQGRYHRWVILTRESIQQGVNPSPYVRTHTQSQHQVTPCQLCQCFSCHQSLTLCQFRPPRRRQRPSHLLCQLGHRDASANRQLRPSPPEEVPICLPSPKKHLTCCTKIMHTCSFIMGAHSVGYPLDQHLSTLSYAMHVECLWTSPCLYANLNIKGFGLKCNPSMIILSSESQDTRDWIRELLHAKWMLYHWPEALPLLMKSCNCWSFFPLFFAILIWN